MVPVLYAAPDSLLERLNRFVKAGGHVVYTFKSGFSNQYVKVRSVHQPGIIDEACGVYYSQFVTPNHVSLRNDPFKVGEKENMVTTWMELLTPTTARVLAYYDHPVWGKYAAVTENSYGKGLATYIGCWTSPTLTEKILQDAVKKAGLWGDDQKFYFPLITKHGINNSGKTVRYVFNYSSKPLTATYPFSDGRELLSGEGIPKNSVLSLPAWGIKIIEEGR